jgi:transposase
MSLSKEERIELVLLSGREGWSYRQIADDFNARHPRMTPICFGTVGKVVRKFKETGRVLDKPRSRRPTVMDDKTREVVIAKVTGHPWRPRLSCARFVTGTDETSRLLKSF